MHNEKTKKAYRYMRETNKLEQMNSKKLIIIDLLKV